MVVGFNFHADVVIAIKTHDARIVAKNADTPVVCPERFTHRMGCSKDRFLEEIVVVGFAGWPRMIDRAPERLVAAVLAPRLRNRFQFDLKRGPAE